MPSCERDPKKKSKAIEGTDELSQFLTYAPNIAGYVDHIAAALDVTPEIGYLLAIESKYATDPTYPAFAMPTSTDPDAALGMWQIQYPTGTTIRRLANNDFKIYKISGGKPNKDDDRTYFLNATYMAAVYLRYLFTQFSDPAVAIVAYRAGPGTAGDIQRAYDPDFDISLKNILNYRKQSRAFCGPITYALHFLALRSIGQNLPKHQINLAPANVDAYKARLQNPRSNLPIQI